MSLLPYHKGNKTNFINLLFTLPLNAIRRYQISNEKPVQESERASVDSYLRFGEISHLAVQRDTITKHY